MNVTIKEMLFSEQYGRVLFFNQYCENEIWDFSLILNMDTLGSRKITKRSRTILVHS